MNYCCFKPANWEWFFFFFNAVIDNWCIISLLALISFFFSVFTVIYLNRQLFRPPFYSWNLFHKFINSSVTFPFILLKMISLQIFRYPSLSYHWWAQINWYLFTKRGHSWQPYHKALSLQFTFYGNILFDLLHNN